MATRARRSGLCLPVSMSPCGCTEETVVHQERQTSQLREKWSEPRPLGSGAAVVRVDQAAAPERQPAPPKRDGLLVVRVDQTSAGATYGLTTMLTGVPLNLNDVTSLWLCAKVAKGFVTLPCPAQMVA